MQNRNLAALIFLSCSLAVTAQEPKPVDETIPQVEIELSAVECTFPPGKSPLASLTCSDIEHLPSKSMKLLDRITARAKTGQRFTANHIINPAAANANPGDKPGFNAFSPGESGTILEAEPVVNADASFVDVNTAYSFRKYADAPDAKTLQELKFTTTFTAKFDYPVLLQVSTVPGHEGTFIAIIARVHLVNANEKPADDAVTSPGK